MKKFAGVSPVFSPGPDEANNANMSPILRDSNSVRQSELGAQKQSVRTANAQHEVVPLLLHNKAAATPATPAVPPGDWGETPGMIALSGLFVIVPLIFHCSM